MFHFFKKKKQSVIKKKPLTIETEFGTFVLRNPEKDTFYEQTMNLFGVECDVSLEVDSLEEKTVYQSLRHFRSFMENIEQWNTRLKAFASEDFCDKDGMIETWEESGEEDCRQIDKAEFERRISIGFIYVYADGNLDIDYDLDGMFTDHGLLFTAHITGKIESVDLYG